MKTVKIARLDLLAKVQENRVTHISEFEEATKGYIEEAIVRMKANLKLAQKEGKIERVISLVQPVSYETQYDKIIAMLEWSTDEFVELDQMEFDQYVRDEWQWKNAFVGATALYNSKAL